MAATQTPSQIPAFRRKLARQMADYRQRTAERIIEARERQGLDREPLALRAGISVKQLRRIEKAQSDARLSTIRKIADALDLQVTDLRPDLEAEEEALQAQLDRLETKTDAILRALLVLLPTEDEIIADVEEALAEAIDAEPTSATPQRSKRHTRRTSASQRQAG